MRKTTIQVMIVSIIAKIFGFVRDKLVSHFFGVGAVSDAFMLSFGIPSMVLTVIASALVTGFIPMYTRVRNKDNEEANSFVNNVFNIMIAFAFILGIVMFLIPEVIVKVTAPGFNQETAQLTAHFVRIVSFSVISVAIVQLGTGYLNVNKSFILPSVISLPSNLFVIGFTILAYKTGNTTFIAIGTLVGFTVQGILMFIYMRIFGFRYKLVFDYKDQNLQEMVRLALPLLMSTALVTVNDMAMRSYATYIADEGAYSYITMSARLLGFATGIFVTGVLSVAYPTVADAAARDDKAKVVKSMNDAILLISMFILPAMVGFITLKYEIVAFVYGGGKVGPEQLEILSYVFLGSALGLFSLALRDLFIRIHYAYHDMKTPLRNQIIYVSTNVVLFIVLGKWLGLMGLTLAGSISATISVFFLFNSLLDKFQRLGMRSIISDLGKLLLSALLMGAAVMGMKYVLGGRLDTSRMLLMATIAVAGIVYAGSVLLLKVEVVQSILKRNGE